MRLRAWKVITSDRVRFAKRFLVVDSIVNMMLNIFEIGDFLVDNIKIEGSKLPRKNFRS